MSFVTRLQRILQLYRHRPRHWRLRPQTIDRRIFRRVVIENEYRLPPCLVGDDVVIDVGGHVGSFSLAALQRGAGRVYCCEPQAGNFRLLRHNLAPWADRVDLRQAAVWRSDSPVEHLALLAPGELAAALPEAARDPRNTGAGRVGDQGGDRVPVVRFDDLVAAAVRRHGRRVRLVKLDCEGAEWPILFTSRNLVQVDAICGEYHAWELPEIYDVAGGPPRTPQALVAFLRAQGFAASWRAEPACPDMGHFFAWRQPFFAEAA